HFLNYFENTVETFDNFEIIEQPVNLCLKEETNEISLFSDEGFEIFKLPVNSSTTIKLFDYYLNTDYAINSTKNNLEYWIGERNGEFYVNKDIENKNKEPLKYPVWRIKFSDIKDFDFDRVETDFSKFDYMQNNKYSKSDEEKLYALDYEKDEIPLPYKEYESGINENYVINVSSEYIADDELWQLDKSNNLTPIWSKNHYVVKWGAHDSISHSDYPYKFNNSYSVGYEYNRTTNIYKSNPDILSKNLDYFYRVGEFRTGNSGETFVHYYDQATNVETSLMNPDSRKFNLKNYMDSEFDYFTYFFDNYRYRRIDNFDQNLKSTKKYSIFNNASKSEPASTIFNGIYYNLINVDYITYNINPDEEYFPQIIDRDDLDSNQYNGYKFSVLFNPAYDYQKGECGRIDNRLIEPLIWYNPIYLKGYDFYSKPLEPNIRGFDSGSTNNVELQLNNYSGLTYYKGKTIRISTFWDNIKKEDEILWMKNNDQLFLKVEYNISGITKDPISFEEIDLNGDFVLFSGDTYYDENFNSINNFYKFDNLTNKNERFISLTNWEIEEFKNKYKDWIDEEILYKRDNKLTNGALIDFENIIKNEDSGIHIFVNDIYKNCLTILNKPILFKQEFIDLNYVDLFENRYGIYNGETINTEELFVTGDTFGTHINKESYITADKPPSKLFGGTYNKKKNISITITNGGLWIYNFDYKSGELIENGVDSFDNTYSFKGISNIENYDNKYYLLDNSGNTYKYNLEDRIIERILDEETSTIYIDKDNENLYMFQSGYSILMYDITNDSLNEINNNISGITGDNLPTEYLRYYTIDSIKNDLYVYGDWGIWKYNINENSGETINSGNTINMDSNDIRNVISYDGKICVIYYDNKKRILVYDTVNEESENKNFTDNISKLLFFENDYLYFLKNDEVIKYNINTNSSEILLDEVYNLYYFIRHNEKFYISYINEFSEYKIKIIDKHNTKTLEHINDDYECINPSIIESNYNNYKLEQDYLLSLTGESEYNESEDFL
ncbi:MAG: hypothetical protein ACOCP8_08190, partial [archaeon]